MMTAGTVERDQSITAAIRDLFQQMDKAPEAVAPIIMLQILHISFPHFAEKAEQGAGYRQQDANGCWTELVRCLQHKLTGITVRILKLLLFFFKKSCNFFINSHKKMEQWLLNLS